MSADRLSIHRNPSPRRQLWPLEENTVTKEPFLRLPAPHRNIILTPNRASDGPAMVPVLNDFRVADNLLSPPYPFLLEHGEGWVTICMNAQGEAMERLERAGNDKDDELVWTEHCLVHVIREQKEDGSDVFIGDCSIGRYRFQEIRDDAKRESLIAENAAKKLGDPTIVWQLGDYLAPSYQGRGIMSSVLKALIENWAIPRMGVRHMRANAFVGNLGSVRVMEKNGFVMDQTVADLFEIPEGKGGGKRSASFMDWKYTG